MIIFLFSVFVGVALGYLKIHAMIDLSWFLIIMLTLFWEIPAIFGAVVALFAAILAVMIGVIALSVVLGVVMLPFCAIGGLIYFLFTKCMKTKRLPL